MGYVIRNNKLRFDYFYGRFLSGFEDSLLQRHDLLIINQIEYLNWTGFESKELVKVPVYLDIHEDNISQADRGPLEKFAFRKYWNWQLRQLERFVAMREKLQITSVERVIADSYSKLLGKPVGVIFNAPDEHELGPSSIDENIIRLVHHGMGTKGRGIETTIRALQKVEKRFTLDLILFSTPQFRLKIEILSRALGVRKRMRILNGVPLAQLIPKLSEYDLSVIIISGVIPGHLNALPNKFFESIHARLGIVTGPNPSMASLVNQHDLGYVMGSWSVSELAQTLNRVSVGELSHFKKKAAQASKLLSSHQSKVVFLEMVKKLVS
jgi:hypothetical protein